MKRRAQRGRPQRTARSVERLAGATVHGAEENADSSQQHASDETAVKRNSRVCTNGP